MGTKGFVWAAAIGAAALALGGSAAAGRGAAVLQHGLPVSAVQSSQFVGVPAQGSYGFLLRLSTESTAHAYYASLRAGKGPARAAAKIQYAAVREAEQRVVASLPSGSHVLYETHALLAGVGVYTDVHNLAALRSIAGVEAVYPIAPKKPSLSYSVPFVRAPQGWQAYSDLGGNSTIAIIDTGIDYTHADLGGPGTTQAYQNALASDTLAPTYPDPNKIIGGYDFAGDAYDPSNPSTATPVPDPNPLDCAGHGTHVAGIAAGYGENPNGTTFTGNYLTLPTDIPSYQPLFRIGPGMAPLAKLYAFKVFGCDGSTNLITEALDRAADPNNDGNPSDHVGVVNMSLGSPFGSPQDADAVAANDAVQAGISVVASAGNSGDLYDISGSPASATRVISVASSVDAYSQIDSITVSAPPAIAGKYGATRSVAYDWANGSDLAGPVVALSQASNKDGCDPLNAADSTAVAGKIAFLEWNSDDTTRRCGSAARSANVVAAGAIGAILADNEEVFSAGITGSSVIPVVMVTKSAGDAIRSHLGSGVTISGTGAADFTQLVPGNDDTVSGFSSRGFGVDGVVKPDVSAIGESVLSASMGSGNAGISYSGTSMSSPMVAGLSALVRTKHPDWTPEEVKADIMNTAGHDLFSGSGQTGNKYAPEREGAGRIDAKSALDNTVLAYLADGSGGVSVSFGPVAVSSATTLEKTVDVVNKGTGPVTYDIAYAPITAVPGATYSVSPASVTLAAGETKTFTVTLTINPALLTKTVDPTVAHSQAGFTREFIAQASGLVLLTSSGLPSLRVPVYSAPRPASTMTQPASLALPKGKVQKATLALTGHGLNQGDGPTAIQSLVAGFELQGKSPALANCSGAATTGCIHAPDERSADLKYVGTTSDAPQLRILGHNPLANGLEYFAISARGPWQSPAGRQEYDIVIDSNGDGAPDAVLFNTRLTDTDIFASALADLHSGQIVDAEPIDARLGNTDAALFDSDTLVMPVAIGAIPGVTATHSRISYGILTFSAFSNEPVDTAGIHLNGNGSLTVDGTLSTDLLHPGVAVFGALSQSSSPFLFLDKPGKLHLLRDSKAYAKDHGKGALIVHFHNAVGKKAQILKLRQKPHHKKHRH